MKLTNALLILGFALSFSALAESNSPEQGDWVFTSGRSEGIPMYFGANSVVKYGIPHQPETIEGTMSIERRTVGYAEQTVFSMSFKGGTLTCEYTAAHLIKGPYALHMINGTKECPSSGTIEKASGPSEFEAPARAERRDLFEDQDDSTYQLHSEPQTSGYSSGGLY